jgi:hypothetical protein
VFEKFLGAKPPPVQNIEETPRKAGRPRKPDSELKQPRKDPARYSKVTGRLLPSKRKQKLQKVHYKVRRKWGRDAKRKSRAKTGLAYERQYNATLRRKYIQSKSVARKYAKKHQLDPDTWFQLTYAEWVILWATSPDVEHPEKGRLKAAQAVANPCLTRWKNVTWASQIDKEKPWMSGNVVIRWNGEPLPNKLNTT